MSALLLGSCSKSLNDSEIETVFGARNVYLKFINKSKYADKNLAFHFDHESSHCSCYGTGSGKGYHFGWQPIATPVDQHNTPFDQLDEEMRERNHPNVYFRGSDIFTWNQDIVVAVFGSDQERFQIKGTSDANNANEINVWLNRWSNRSKDIKLECSRIEVGKDRLHEWSVYIDIVVLNN